MGVRGHGVTSLLGGLVYSLFNYNRSLKHSQDGLKYS